MRIFFYQELHELENTSSNYESDKSIQFDVFVFVAHEGEVALEVLAAYHHRTAAVVGMEREGLCPAQVLVEEEVHMALRVVDESEGRHAARLQSQIFHHALGRGERELSA